MLDALFIGAHPDDCELFVGGTIALLSSQGYSVGVLDLTEGEKSSRGNREQRKQEKETASKLLGISERMTLDLGDTSLFPTDERIREIIEALRRLRPKFVFFENPNDRHPDHVKASNLAQQALFYARLHNHPASGEPLHINGYAFYIGNTLMPVHPTMVVNISATYPRKLEALVAYRTQFFNPGVAAAPTYISSREFLTFIEVRARYYGGLIGAEFGEGFILDRPLNISNPFPLLLDQKFL